MLKVQKGSLLGSLCVNFPAKITMHNPRAPIQKVKYGLCKLIDHDLLSTKGGLDSNDLRKSGKSPQILHSWKLISSTVALKFHCTVHFLKEKGNR
jgi:hypothetical protein